MTRDPSVPDYGQQLREQWRADRMRAAITPGSPDAAQLHRLGDRSYVAFPQGIIAGWSAISIGDDCVINEFTSLTAGFPGLEPTSPAPVITIGDRCVLGRRAEIIAMDSVVLEHDVWTGPDVYITDHHHRYDLTDGTPIARQWPLDVRPVRIGAGSLLSARVVVLAGVELGHHTLVAAGAVVRPGRYPPHVVLAGVPARPTRRWDGTTWTTTQ